MFVLLLNKPLKYTLLFEEFGKTTNNIGGKKRLGYSFIR